MIERELVKNSETTLLFGDFSKALHSIDRGKMGQILLAYGLPIETVTTKTGKQWFTLLMETPTSSTKSLESCKDLNGTFVYTLLRIHTSIVNRSNKVISLQKNQAAEKIWQIQNRQTTWHQPSQNTYCILLSKQQEASVTSWMQIKYSKCVLNKKEPSLH